MSNLFKFVSVCLVTITTAALSLNTYALDEKLILGVSEDVSKKSNTYQIAGGDAFFVLRIKQQANPSGSNIGPRKLLLPFELTNQPADTETLQAEIFFKKELAKSTPYTEGFEVFNRFKIEFDSGVVGGIVVPISAEIDLSADDLIRFDIEGCAGCKLTFLAPPILVGKDIVSNSPYSDLGSVEIVKAFEGKKSVPDRGLPLVAGLWELNDARKLKSKADITFRPTGGDPFLRSALIEVTTDNLAGVLFRMKVSQSSTNLHDFQLFYATEQHRFIEEATSIFRVTDKEGELEFFVPLDFLGTQSPQQSALMRLRLDLASHSVLGADTAKSRKRAQWQLQESLLVNKQQAERYKALIPDTLVHIKLQRASKNQIVRQIMTNITDDLAFIGIYIFGFILLVVYLLRQFNRSKNL